MEYFYSYQVTVVNYIKLYISYQEGANTPVQSNRLVLSYGEWTPVGIYFNEASGTYTLDLAKYGTATISAATYSPTSVTLNPSDSRLAIYMKELLIWDEELSSNPLIGSHKCQ